MPESLRREVIELMPKEDVEGLHPVGKEITEKLEYRPSELFVKQYVRPEYIKPSNDGLNASRIIASLPAMPLEKSVAGASLLTHLLVSKFVDPSACVSPVSHLQTSKCKHQSQHGKRLDKRCDEVD
ncbi:MAG: hypothetical protein IPH58_17580 [Sphingobacteriales bacterium]|nr:hypothetical protein [Sphingobacteriales bacterium]